MTYIDDGKQENEINILKKTPWPTKNFPKWPIQTLYDGSTTDICQIANWWIKSKNNYPTKKWSDNSNNANRQFHGKNFYELNFLIIRKSDKYEKEKRRLERNLAKILLIYKSKYTWGTNYWFFWMVAGKLRIAENKKNKNMRNRI